MCDTFGALASWTGTGQAIFGKNSDREPDETQVVIALPAQKHAAGAQIRCTYLSIPQAAATQAVLLSKPFWMWGAEMGVNACGVVIGNEAIFTRTKPEKNPGLIGMDLLRLALERSETARQAAEVITALLKQYGQGGPCGYRDKRMTYMNSFLIMDFSEILVLETVGRDHVLKAYRDHAAISNAISLETDWDEGSLPPGTNIKRLGDPLMTYFAGGRARRLCSLERLMGTCGRMEVPDAFDLLRSHNPLGGFNHDVCMHAEGSLIRRSQTTGSLVVALDGQGQFKIFVTAGSAPCLTPFKPVLPNHLPADLSTGGAGYRPDSFWWRHEVFHVRALQCTGAWRDQVSGAIREIERGARDLPFYAWDTDNTDLVDRSQESFAAAQRMEQEHLAATRDCQGRLSRYWRRVARRNGLPLE